ncbi:ribosomal subunit 39S-domain-containing protein [Xylariomycetidae sp. FL2044]|nr:ribosomal subunit 39S-domain-containing protein [Xylariomycetidae sp. FL2044]
MRRIPRLRRPSGHLASYSNSSATAHPHALVSASSLQPRPTRRPTTPLPSASLARLYSTSNDKSTSNGKPLPQSLAQAPAPAPSEEVVDTPNEENWEELPEELPSHDNYVPPPERSYAERSEEVTDPHYVPASTADGLDTIGGLGDWWDRKGHWSQTGNFVGFKPRKKVQDQRVLEASVRRAVSETYALLQAGQDDRLVTSWPVGDQVDFERVLELDVKAGADGAVSLSGDVSGLLGALQNKDELVEATAETVSRRPSELPRVPIEKYKVNWDQSWKKISLSDPRVKFAVTKRVFQLTGHLVPDHQLSSLANVHSLLRVVQKPPKPVTLTEEIQKHRQDIVTMPNVSVHAKRLTRGDREKAVGRFKLIEEEFRKRDLPLRGHGGASKNREIPRLKGET